MVISPEWLRGVAEARLLVLKCMFGARGLLRNVMGMAGFPAVRFGASASVLSTAWLRDDTVRKATLNGIFSNRSMLEDVAQSQRRSAVTRPSSRSRKASTQLP